MNVLIIVPYGLFQAKNGNEIRVKAMLETLVESGHRISLLMYSPLTCRNGIINAEFPVYSYATRLEILFASFALHKIFGVSVYDFLCAKFEPIYFIRSRLQEIIAREKIDIIQCENIWTVPLDKKLNRKIPIVATLHDVFSNRYEQVFKQLKKGSLYPNWLLEQIRDFERKEIKHPSFSVCVSEEDKNTFIDMGGIPEKMVVIPNGVDTQKIKPSPKDISLMNKFGLKHEDFVLFFGGSDQLQNVKSVNDIFNKIFPRLMKYRPNIKIMFTGTLCKYIDSHNFTKLYPDNILNIGYVDQISSYYSLVDIVVLPITIGTGTKLKAVEAFAAGKPVVSTDLGVVGYNVNNGEDLIIENNIERFHERIISLLRYPYLRKKLGENARKQSLKYDWKTLLKKYNTLYQMLR